MRLAPPHDERSPTESAGVSVFQPGQELWRSTERHFGGLLSISEPTALASGISRTDGVLPRSNTFKNGPRLTSDNPIRPIITRTAPWVDLHVEAEKRNHATEVDAVQGTCYAQYDAQTTHGGEIPISDRWGPVEVPLRQLPVTASPTEASETDVPPKPTRTPRRHEQCRANQARYRERQKHKVWAKEEEAARLRELVNLLEAQRSLTRAGSSRFALAQHIIVELFRRYRNGLSGARSSESVRTASSATKSTAELPFKWHMARHIERNLIFLKQIAFVRTIITKDADVGHGRRGSDAVLEQWWQYSTFHGSLKLDLISVKQEYSSDPDIERAVVTGSLKVTVTEQTITMVFPDLPPRLHHALLGATLNYSLRLRLDLEEADTPPLLQVTKLHTELDVVSALLDVLRDPSAVERVLRYARISSDGVIGKPSRMYDML